MDFSSDPQPTTYAVLRPWLWGALLLTTFISCQYRYDYQGVDVIDPRALAAPRQLPPTSTKPITFSRDGFAYTATPLFEYEMNGLVLLAENYDFLSLTRIDKAIPVDLCLFWGENLQKKAHQQKALRVWQESRFCMFQYGPGAHLDSQAFSNNHLVARDAAVSDAIQSISGGDQVRIRGKLVTLEAKNIDGKLKNMEDPVERWSSSTRRDDTGAGACEVIYVEEVEFLRKGNPVARTAFKLALAGLGLLTLLILYSRFRPRPVPSYENPSW